MTAKQRKKRNDPKPMIFSALNYKLMGLGLILVIAGFTAMYLENEIHGFISLYISPVVIMAGYALVLAAILKRKKKSSDLHPSTG